VTVRGATRTSVSPADLRRWLTDLREPHRLADPVMCELLASSQRLPAASSPVAVGRAAAELLYDAIERTRADEDASRKAQLPYLVLQTCFVDGTKLESAAEKFGLSVRQLSRERGRAIELLHAELMAEVADAAMGAAAGYCFEPIPTISGFVPRPTVSAELRRALDEHRIVHVHGAAGIGKTTAVAELAAELAVATPALWYRLRPGVNDSIGPALFELAQHLRAHGRPRLHELTTASLPAVEEMMLSRVALEELASFPTLLVFDDYHLSEPDHRIGAFLDDAATRLDTLRVLTVGRHQEPRPRAGTPVSVPGLTLAETQQLLRQLLSTTTPELAVTVHAWTQGVPQLTQMAASWLGSATPDEITGGMSVFTDRDEVQAFLLDSLTELMDSYDRDILEAASVFRGRFSDQLLAAVAGRTMGEVADVSRRLVRFHIATRSRQGQVAFIHASVQDYVYRRLGPARAAELHRRAAQCFRAEGEADESAYHQRLAEQPAQAMAAVGAP